MLFRKESRLLRVPLFYRGEYLVVGLNGGAEQSEVLLVPPPHMDVGLREKPFGYRDYIFVIGGLRDAKMKGGVKVEEMLHVVGLKHPLGIGDQPFELFYLLRLRAAITATEGSSAILASSASKEPLTFSVSSRNFSKIPRGADFPDGAL